MNKTKTFFDTTKYLWLGAALGLLQQIFGRLDYALYYSKSISPVFSFSGILGGYAFWAFAILMLIFRKAEPKKQFRDILLLFAGLDMTYYLWQFLQELPSVLRGNLKVTCLGTDGIAAIALAAFIDFLMYTAVGAAAGAWGAFATKLRNKGSKKGYIAMLSPLFFVITIEFIGAVVGVVNFFNWKSQVSAGTAPTGIAYTCTVDGAMTGAVMLALAVIFFLRSRKTAILKFC